MTHAAIYLGSNTCSFLQEDFCHQAAIDSECMTSAENCNVFMQSHDHLDVALLRGGVVGIHSSGLEFGQIFVSQFTFVAAALEVPVVMTGTFAAQASRAQVGFLQRGWNSMGFVLL